DTKGSPRAPPMAASRTGRSTILPAGVLLGSTDFRPQRRQILSDRARGVAFDPAVALDQRDTERRQQCTAAVPAASLALDRGMSADAVDLVHQIPGPLVGHVHRAPRGGNRAAGMDVL